MAFDLRRLRVGYAVGATGVLVVLSACGGGGPQPGTAATAAPQAAGQSVAPQPTASAATKAGATLKSAGGSAASGTATLEQTGDKVTYKVTVTGATPGTHALYVLQTCEGAGNRTGPLTAVEASGEGQGTAEGTLLAQLGSLVGRALGVYAGDKGDSAVIACGAIAATP